MLIFAEKTVIIVFEGHADNGVLRCIGNGRDASPAVFHVFRGINRKQTVLKRDSLPVYANIRAYRPGGTSCVAAVSFSNTESHAVSSITL